MVCPTSSTSARSALSIVSVKMETLPSGSVGIRIFSACSHAGRRPQRLGVSHQRPRHRAAS